MRVVGADACSKGWVAVSLRNGCFESIGAYLKFADVVSTFSDTQVIAVDIPIGLPLGKEPRAADAAARKFLTGGASSVFPVPPRAVLLSRTYSEARTLASATWGRSISAQSFALARKILEVEDAVADGRIKEVHPEVSFRALKGDRLLARKKSWNGANERRVLLAGAGISLPDHLHGAGDVGMDDVLDAAVAAWSADRIAKGVAECLPTEPEMIEGREVAIWY